jgi:hypothetical protein
MFVVGLLLASNYRGLGNKWIEIALPKKGDLDLERRRLIKRYRIYYGSASVLGGLMLVAGIARL